LLKVKGEEAVWCVHDAHACIPRGLLKVKGEEAVWWTEHTTPDEHAKPFG